jgi:hypothetical protein
MPSCTDKWRKGPHKGLTGRKSAESKQKNDHTQTITTRFNVIKSEKTGFESPPALKRRFSKVPSIVPQKIFHELTNPTDYFSDAELTHWLKATCLKN